MYSTMLRNQPKRFSINFNSKRWKSHKKINNQTKRTPTIRAMEHFDDFYGNVYGKVWRSIRIALLSPNKFNAIVNNFGDTESVCANLEANGAFNLRKLIALERSERENTPKTTTNISAQMQTVSEINEVNELNRINPNKDHALNDVNDEKLLEKPTYSLEKSSTEIDTSRIIDPEKDLAHLYEYIPATKIKGMDDWILESEHYKYYDDHAEFPVDVQPEERLVVPDNLNVYTYETGNITRFSAPKRCSTGVLDCYLMDGGSVLPALALDVQPGDDVLDMCAAPGGKSLIFLQTLHPRHLICNDINEGRLNRVRKVLSEYLYDVPRRLADKSLILCQQDGRTIDQRDLFDRILVDVPCTTDRHSIVNDDNNIFKPDRTKERLRVPELQSALLTNALKLVKNHGTVVYSTCALSPIQNDGVVQMALKTIWTETKRKIVVKDLKAALKPYGNLYSVDNDTGLKYGHLVVPFLHCNYGPMYFCKLERVE